MRHGPGLECGSDVAIADVGSSLSPEYLFGSWHEGHAMLRRLRIQKLARVVVGSIADEFALSFAQCSSSRKKSHSWIPGTSEDSGAT